MDRSDEAVDIKEEEVVNLLITAEPVLSTSISPHSIVDNCDHENFVYNIGEKESKKPSVGYTTKALVSVIRNFLKR